MLVGIGLSDTEGRSSTHTLTKGLSHIYADSPPENRNRKVMMREIVQPMNENTATKRVRMVDFRRRCFSASRAFRGVRHIENILGGVYSCRKNGTRCWLVRRPSPILGLRRLPSWGWFAQGRLTGGRECSLGCNKKTFLLRANQGQHRKQQFFNASRKKDKSLTGNSPF